MRVQFGGSEAAFYVGAGWRHAFGDVRPATTLAFDGSQPYTGQFGGGNQDHTGTVRLRWRF